MCVLVSPPRVLLPHTCTQDRWFLQPKHRPAWSPRRTVPSNCICRCSRMHVRLSPPRVLLPHTCTQDGWFLQPKHRPAWPPCRTVPSNCICRCSRMRNCLPLHIPSSTHRFPNDHTPIEATSLSVTSAELGLGLAGLGLGLGLDSLLHSSSDTLPSSRHPPFTH
jgi:hypothetical protein